jgi:hypothetical protein
MQPLDLGLNVAVMRIASRLFPLGFDVTEHAPASYEELKEHLDAGKRLIVYSGGSDNTIYGDREVNWHFRAWHDWCHYHGQYRLTFDGEAAVCALQSQHLISLYGDGPDTRRWSWIIHAEIIGQAQFYRWHKRFPDDQRGFITAYLRNSQDALLWSLW